MESNQNQNTYNKFNTRETNNNTQQQQLGNWRSKGLEGITYPEQKTQNFQKRNFAENNYHNNKNNNNNYNNNFNNFNNYNNNNNNNTR